MNDGTLKTMFSSAKGDWGTPQSFFDKLNREFHFDIDVAASAENAKCARFIDAEQNGLQTPWHGRDDDGHIPYTAWCNPPYGRGLASWCDKANVERGIYGVTTVMLIPARTDTLWFHAYAPSCEVRFVKGRLTFEGAPGPAPFPSLLLVFRPFSDERWMTMRVS
jgi:phage N-6-adenine-methyltransferase